MLPSGALDRSFGSRGYLSSTGEKVAFLEGESGTVGACAETLSTSGSLLTAYEGFALEELSPAGAVVSSFANDPTQQPGGLLTAFQTKNPYHFCNGLFALSGGSVEGISGREVTRLTPAGMPDTAFGGAGSTRIGFPSEAAAVSSSGETFLAGHRGRALLLSGVLPDGRGDPALGGPGGMRFPVVLPEGTGSVPGNEEAPSWEVLPVANNLFVRVGEEVLRVERRG